MRVRTVLCAMALALTASPAAAQDDDAPDDAVRLSADADARPGDYKGVEPGEGGAPGVHRRHGKVPLVTWIGFQPQEGGGARVFIQLDREVTYRQEVRNGALVVSLDGVQYANSNARRPLDTRFFETPVERITTQPAGRRGRRGARGRGIELAIKFKNPADAREATAAMNTAKDGFTYLLLDVGPGSAPAR